MSTPNPCTNDAEPTPADPTTDEGSKPEPEPDASLISSHVGETLGLDTAKGSYRSRRILLIGAALLAAVSIVVFLRSGGGTEVEYQTANAKRGELTILVMATGNLEPINQVDVGIEVSGTIESVEVDYNDNVTVGQALASLDTTILEAQASQFAARLRSAEATVQQAQATVREVRVQLQRLERVRDLSGGKVPAQSDLDAAEASLSRGLADAAAAEATVAEARANLTVAETELSKAVIRSPINGIVLQRNVEPGQTVAASLQAPELFTLAENLTQMALHVDVDEADVGQVRVGQQVTFTVDAYPERTFAAQVAQVRFGAQEAEGVVTYETVLNVNNDDRLLRPGMTATADIVVDRISDVLVVPSSALRFSPPVTSDDDGGRGFIGSLLARPPRRERRDRSVEVRQSVWILQDGLPIRVAVATGATDGVITEIVGGELTAGSAVITDMVTSE
ncbi:MAG: efflux RND transporter periplasmic adaptor subunit [Pseudomonadota bacterium]